MTAFLAGILGPIIRPLLREQLDDLKEFFLNEITKLKNEVLDSRARLETYKKYDAEALQLIEAAETATTTEEVRAQLRRLKQSRARIGV